MAGLTASEMNENIELTEMNENIICTQTSQEKVLKMAVKKQGKPVFVEIFAAL